MPTIYPLPSGSYRAQVYVNKKRASKSFRTRREALAWGNAKEEELRSLSSKPEGDKHTLGELLNKYVEEVSSGKRGARWERIRLAAMSKMLPVGSPAGSIGDEVIREYRDARKKRVKPGTILRELGLLSSVFEHARTELKWIDINPVNDVAKPGRPDHRRVTIGRKTIRAMLVEMGYSPVCRITSVSGACAMAFLLALRTGCRAGELCKLRWSEVYLDHFHVSEKTPAGDRDIPITPKVDRLLERMRGFDPVFVLGISVKSLDPMFRKYRKRAGLEGFTFHDTRHTAATWIVQNSNINVLELCKLFGWTDPKMAMVYFNPTAKDLKERLMTKRA